MKETYFTPDTLATKAAQIYRQVEPYRRTVNVPFEPRKSALLVLDMQSYFLQPASHAYVPSAKAILPGVSALVRAYSACGLPVIFTRHINTPQDAGMMARWWHDLITIENPLSEIIPELDTSKGLVLHKTRYDAFYCTSLEDELRQKSVQQLVITGVMTHLCCETTARAAFMRGFEVFFLLDGTATYNQRFHRAALLNLAHGFAVITWVDAIRSAIRGINAG